VGTIRTAGTGCDRGKGARDFETFSECHFFLAPTGADLWLRAKRPVGEPFKELMRTPPREAGAAGGFAKAHKDVIAPAAAASASP